MVCLVMDSTLSSTYTTVFRKQSTKYDTNTEYISPISDIVMGIFSFLDVQNIHLVKLKFPMYLTFLTWYPKKLTIRLNFSSDAKVRTYINPP